MDPDRTISAAARDSKRDFGVMIESSPLAIISYDPEGVVTSWNPAAERLFGWTAGEATGKRLPFVQAEKQAEFEGLLARALRGEAYIEPGLHRRRADGSPVVVRVCAAPLRGGDGSVYGVMEILWDEAGRTEEEEWRALLPSALEQAGDSVILTDARGVILYANAAFERTSGFRRKDVIGRKWEAVGRGETWRGTLVSRKKDGTPFEMDAVISPVRDAAGRIVNHLGVQREAAIPRKSEDRAPQDGGRPPAAGRAPLFRPGPLDLNGVLAGMERMLRRLSGGAVQLSLALDRGIPPVTATRGKVEQLVATLTGHARSLMPSGGRITIRTGNAGRDVTLSVEAEGEGMDARDAAWPAEVSGIVDECGKPVRVEPAAGGSAGVRVRFPRVEPTSQERRAAGRGIPGALTSGTGTVLLVDDEDVVRLPAGEILRGCGYDVIEARNGREALLLSEAQQGRIDLLLTDVMMPKMDGLELAKRLREKRPGTKTLYMSGCTSKGAIDDPGDGVAFLQKPFTAETLSLRVREMLDS
jgi:PAS domain S-box-containing protein